MKATGSFLFLALISVSLILAACNAEPGARKVNTTDINELTIAKFHESLKAGRLSCEGLVSAYLKRIKKLDPRANAISYVNPKAVEMAKALDREFNRTGWLRPLHGVPIIVKDNYNTRGMPTTAGSVSLKAFEPDEDSFIVRRMLEAGAVIVAKSNMAEWAFSPMHTESSTVGTTKNPYNPEYVPAGSSGGTAAAVALNLGLVGLGTDTGNSIRGPSSHTALVGFRATMGLTSRHGIVPLYLRNDVGGPMCRTVEDCTRVLEVIAGYDPKDPLTRYSKDKIPDGYTQYLLDDGLRDARIGVLTELSEKDPDPEIKALFKNAVRDIKKLGATVVEKVDVPGFQDLRKNQWCDEFRKDIEAYLREFVKDDSLRSLEDIVKVGTRSEYARESLEYFLEHSGREKNREIKCADAFTDERRIAFRQAIEKRMDDLNLDALIYPTWNNKPAKLDRYREEYKGDNNQVVAPHTGQPAFTVPMGFTKGNLPAGLQFLGRMFSEPKLIRFVYAYEQGTHHRVPPDLR